MGFGAKSSKKKLTVVVLPTLNLKWAGFDWLCLVCWMVGYSSLVASRWSSPAGCSPTEQAVRGGYEEDSNSVEPSKNTALLPRSVSLLVSVCLTDCLLAS
jgi:hypothetical protein